MDSDGTPKWQTPEEIWDELSNYPEDEPLPEDKEKWCSAISGARVPKHDKYQHIYDIDKNVDWLQAHYSPIAPGGAEQGSAGSWQPSRPGPKHTADSVVATSSRGPARSSLGEEKALELSSLLISGRFGRERRHKVPAPPSVDDEQAFPPLSTSRASTTRSSSVSSPTGWQSAPGGYATAPQGSSPPGSARGRPSYSPDPLERDLEDLSAITGGPRHRRSTSASQGTAPVSWDPTVQLNPRQGHQGKSKRSGLSQVSYPGE